MTLEKAKKLIPFVSIVKVYIWNSAQTEKIWVEGLVTSVETRKAHDEEWIVIYAVYDEPIDERRGYHHKNIEIVEFC
jgi:hypothetical protein